MGLFNALIVLVVGIFTMTFIEDKSSKINNIPIIKNLVSDKVKENKTLIVIIAIALVQFIL